MLERRLAEYALGIVAALRSGGLSIEQAGDDLFNLDNLRLMRERFKPALMELLEWGMELEDAMTRLAERLISRAAG